MFAYCWANGVIEFARKTPEGALPIASGPKRELMDFIAGVSRHAWDGETLLVPGVPEARHPIAAVDALEAFLKWIGKHPHGRLTIFTRSHRWPVSGKKAA